MSFLNIEMFTKKYDSGPLNFSIKSILLIIYIIKNLIYLLFGWHKLDFINISKICYEIGEKKEELLYKIIKNIQLNIQKFREYYIWSEQSFLLNFGENKN